MILVNTDFISGKELETLSLVKGSTIQSKHIGKDIAQSFKTLVGGELKSYNEMMNEARALATKRMVAEAKRIAEINAKNAKKSPGAAGKDTAGEYFSPEDVRRMSRAEVHANYSKIKDSMKKWM